MTTKRQLIQEALEAGERPSDIAIRIGVTRARVSQIRSGMPGVQKRRRCRKAEIVAALIHGQKSRSEIARELGASTSYVCYLAREIGLPAMYAPRATSETANA